MNDVSGAYENVISFWWNVFLTFNKRTINNRLWFSIQNKFSDKIQCKYVINDSKIVIIKVEYSSLGLRLYFVLTTVSIFVTSSFSSASIDLRCIGSVIEHFTPLPPSLPIDASKSLNYTLTASPSTSVCRIWYPPSRPPWKIQACSQLMPSCLHGHHRDTCTCVSNETMHCISCFASDLHISSAWN